MERSIEKRIEDKEAKGLERRMAKVIWIKPIPIRGS